MVGVDEVLEIIEEIMDDSTLPKNIKNKLSEISKVLKDSDGKNLKLKVDKCVNDLDEISSDVNIQPFVRTQIWSVVSMLEALE